MIRVCGLMAAALAGLILVLSVSARADATAAADSLRNGLAAELDRQGLEGAVWALVTPAGVETGAAGVRNATTGQPMSPTDRVHVGSVAKTLVAVGILRLVSDGRLALDAPVADILPEIGLVNPWEASHPVRVRHLLDHTAGLDGSRLWHFFSLRAGPDTPLDRAIGKDPEILRLRTPPGSRFSYSNLGYHLAGMVIERVTGARFESWLDANLLRPLGMIDSTFAFTTQATDPRLAMGHFEAGVPAPALPTWLRPSAQFTTTAADMARLARFLMGDGSLDGQMLIRADLLRAMGHPSATEAATAGLMVGYGLGLGRRDWIEGPANCHAGNIIGYRAMVCLYPEEGKAFFISINADSEDADYGRLDALLHRALDPAPPVTAPAIPMPAGADAWTGFYAQSPNRFETLAYLDRLFGFATLSEQDGRLTFTRFQGATAVLHPVAGPGPGLLFRPGTQPSPAIVLLTTDHGARAISNGLRTWEQTGTISLIALWVGLGAGLVGIAYLLVSGLLRLRHGAWRPLDPIMPPFLGVVALLLPVPFLATQDYMSIGDPSLGSVLLALATGLLPLAVLFGVLHRMWLGLGCWRARFDAAAMVAVLQWTATLATFELAPLKLWT